MEPNPSERSFAMPRLRTCSIRIRPIPPTWTPARHPRPRAKPRRDSFRVSTQTGSLSCKAPMKIFLLVPPLQSSLQNISTITPTLPCPVLCVPHAHDPYLGFRHGNGNTPSGPWGVNIPLHMGRERRGDPSHEVRTAQPTLHQTISTCSLPSLTTTPTTE
jgi:hypothetical protein